MLKTLGKVSYFWEVRLGRTSCPAYVEADMIFCEKLFFLGISYQGWLMQSKEQELGRSWHNPSRQGCAQGKRWEATWRPQQMSFSETGAELSIAAQHQGWQQRGCLLACALLSFIFPFKFKQSNKLHPWWPSQRPAKRTQSAIQA